MNLKNIVNSLVLSSIVALPMQARPQDFNDEDLIVEEIERKNREQIKEPKIDIPTPTKRYHGYWLTDEEFENVNAYANILDKYELHSYLGFVALMRYNDLVKFVSDYYEINPLSVYEVMNQESAFSMVARGKFGERGLGQQVKGTAQSLVDMITDSGSELYYPFLKKEDYSFQKLSKDYRLNIILTGVKIKLAEYDLNDALEERGMTKQELADFITNKGSTIKFNYIKKSEKFNFYRMNSRANKRVNRFWKDGTVEDRDLAYLAYNGGKGSVDNLLRKRLISEVLIVNFTGYCKRKGLVQHFMSLYDYDVEMID